MKFARILDAKVYDICPGNPAEYYHPDVAKLYTEQIEDDTEIGATWDGQHWVNPIPSAPEPLPPALIPIIGPIAFQMLFHVEELVAIDAAKETDPVVRIFWNLLNDPRTDVVDRNLKTVQDGLHYLEAKNLIGAGRAQEILTGEVTK